MFRSRPIFRTSLAVLAAGSLSQCATSRVQPSAEFPAEFWHNAGPEDSPYLLAPGDTVDIVVHSAPELSRTLDIGPDGRLRMPLAAPVIAQARTPEEIAISLEFALKNELNDPDLDVIPTKFASQQIFVGGEVRTPGMFDLPGQIDPLQATIMAGGVTRQGRIREVIIMRRLPGGEVRSVVFDLKAGTLDPEFASFLPLRRFDIVYVPSTRISDQNQFVEQYIRNALPIQFSLFYDVRSGQ
jgi:protein involved in polysaccharide export with SLBB domain